MTPSKWILSVFLLFLVAGLIWLVHSQYPSAPSSSDSEQELAPGVALEHAKEFAPGVAQPKGKPKDAKIEEIAATPEKVNEPDPTPENPKTLANGWKVARGPVRSGEKTAPQTRHFDSASLAELGFTDSEIDRIYAGWETAMSERGPYALKGGSGGLGKNRSAMRDSMGDYDYDAALYASGVGNRVLIKRVVAGGAAEAAGVSAGDRILIYKGERIFGLPELSHMVRQTSPRGLVNIVVEDADGNFTNLEIPGGWAAPGFVLVESSESPLTP